jgi:hypothetical protein
MLSLPLEIAGYTGKAWAANITGRIVRNVLPWVYYIVALGILALGQVYTEFGFLGFLHHLPQGLMTAISGVIFLTLTAFTFYHSSRLGARYWEEMEI